MVNIVRYGRVVSDGPGKYGSRRLELEAEVPEGYDYKAVYDSLRHKVHTLLGIGPSKDAIDQARETLKEAGIEIN